MKGLKEREVLSFISALLAGTMFLSACSVDFNKVGEAFVNLGENVSEVVNDTEDTEEDDVIVVEPAETEVVAEETEPSEEIPEPTATPTPTPTPSPTPSPTPMPERVDFSDLTQTAVTESITVDVEEFEESCHSEDDDILLASFTGTRMLIEDRESARIASSVNLVLNSFYLEAEGLYGKYKSQAQARYDLTGEIDDPVEVTVNYDHDFNGRILSVIMTLSVKQGEEVFEDKTEYTSYDLYTGQYVVPSLYATDSDALNLAILTAYAESTEATNDRAADYSVIYIGAQAESSDGEEDDSEETPARVLIQSDEGVVEYVINLNDYAEYFTRYGMVIFDITLPSEEAEEEATEEESDEENEDESEEADEEESEETEETEADEESSETEEDDSEEAAEN